MWEARTPKEDLTLSPFPGFVPLFLVFALPLAVVHRLGDWRFGGGLDQDQVETHVLRFAHGGGRGHDLHGAVGKDGAHFARADRFIYVLPDPRPAELKSLWDSSASNRVSEPQRAEQGDGKIAMLKQ